MAVFTNILMLRKFYEWAKFFLNKNFKICWNLLMSKSNNDKLDATAKQNTGSVLYLDILVIMKLQWEIIYSYSGDVFIIVPK